MNKKINAFTIMELTVSLLLAAVIITITYTCYSIIYKNYLVFSIRQQGLAEISQFNQVLGRDIEKARLILKNDYGIIIKVNNSDINYLFQPDFILRVTGRTDTFKIKTAELSTYFEGHEVLTAADGQENNRVDGISFNIISGNDKFPYYYFKQYSSENLINRNPNAVN